MNDSLPYGVRYTTTNRPCKHENGWWVTVRFWLFSKRVFVCSDCGEALTKGSS